MAFCLFFILFDRFGFYLITRMEQNFYSEEEYKSEFINYAKNRKFSTLILGTSRTYEAIHPLYFRTILNENAFKEAQFGKNPKYNYHYYHFFKKHAGIPDVVIYGIDYFIFNSRSHKRWLARLDKLHKQVSPFSSFSLLLSHKQEVENFIEAVIDHWNNLFSPGQRHRVMDLIRLQKYIGSPHKPGTVVTEKKRNFWRQKYRKYPGNEGRFLFRLLRELDRDGVTTFLVLIPNHFGTFRTNTGRKSMLRDLFQLKHGLNHVHIINFNKPEKFPLNREEYFINGGWGRTNSHMSRSGAKLFNQLLLKEIRPYYRKIRGNLSSTFRKKRKAQNHAP